MAYGHYHQAVYGLDLLPKIGVVSGVRATLRPEYRFYVRACKNQAIHACICCEEICRRRQKVFIHQVNGSCSLGSRGRGAMDLSLNQQAGDCLCGIQHFKYQGSSATRSKTVPAQAIANPQRRTAPPRYRLRSTVLSVLLPAT